MFNDPLTHEQCERLVQQLAQTSLPFQCAHGRYVLRPIRSARLIVMHFVLRPSMVPLTNVLNQGREARRTVADVDWTQFDRSFSSAD